MRFSDITEDPETSVAAKSLERMVFDRAMNRLASYISTKASFPKVCKRRRRMSKQSFG